MTALDLRPAATPAPPVRRVLRHAWLETSLLLRNGDQLLLALLIPIGLLILGRLLGGRLGQLVTLAPSVLALAVWSSAFTSLAIATGFERRYGVLERLAATPLRRSGLLLGKSGAVLIVVALQLVVLSVVALALGWRPTPTPASVLVAIVVVALATGTFAALGLLLAGRLRAELTLGLANVIYVVLLAAGGLVLPVARYPAALRPLIDGLPTAALGEGLRGAAAGVPLGWPVAVLAAWFVLAALAAGKGFRWMS